MNHLAASGTCTKATAPLYSSNWPHPQNEEGKNTTASIPIVCYHCTPSVHSDANFHIMQYQVFAGVDFEFFVEEFIGINIAMGLLRLPQVRDYWSTSEILSTPWFSTIMSRDRLFAIMKYLHLETKKERRGGLQSSVQNSSLSRSPFCCVCPLL